MEVKFNVVKNNIANVSSMNQGILEMVKQEMARVNIDILGDSSVDKESPAMQETLVRFLGQEDPLEKG